MDKFVTRTKIKRNTIPRKKEIRKYKQIRISDMKGVVNIDELKSIKKILKTETDPEILEEKLKILDSKLPAVSVLQSVKICRHMENLGNNPNRNVAELARNICNKVSSELIKS